MGDGTFNAPKFGLFGATFHAADPYGMKAASSDTRYKGAQFGTRQVLHGKGVEVTFSKPLRLFEGETYVTLTQHRNRERMKDLKSQPDKEAFKPANPGKMSTGPGTFHGLFGGKIEYIEDGVYSRPKKFGGHETKPNILTTGPKKGSFGVPGTTIGKYGTTLGNKGVMGEFEYISEPYDGARIAATAAKKAAREARKDADPFKPTNPTKKGTYGTPGIVINSHAYLKVGGVTGVCGEYTYVEQGPKERKPIEVDAAAKDPFKPPMPPKSGRLGTIGKFPEFREDPYELKQLAEKTALAQSRQLKTNAEPFRPSSYPKMTATRSVFRMNIK